MLQAGGVACSPVYVCAGAGCTCRVDLQGTNHHGPADDDRASPRSSPGAKATSKHSQVAPGERGISRVPKTGAAPQLNSSLEMSDTSSDHRRCLSPWDAAEEEGRGARFSRRALVREGEFACDWIRCPLQVGFIAKVGLDSCLIYHNIWQHEKE